MAILTSHAYSITAPKDEHQPGHPDLLRPLRRWINQIQFTNRWLARLICRVIPSRCPFERDISLLGRTVHIPALCRVNPVYDEIISLRSRALAYLTDVCGENVASYIR